jgi:hypothetical protein
MFVRSHSHPGQGERQEYSRRSLRLSRAGHLLCLRDLGGGQVGRDLGERLGRGLVIA